MVSTLCFAFLAVLFGLRRRLGLDYFDPLVLYLASQFGGLGIAYLKFKPAMTDWHALTWVVFLGSAALFTAGSLLARHFRDRNLRPEPAFPQWLVAGILLLFLVWASAGFWAGMSLGGIPLMASDPEAARKAFNGVRFAVAFGLQNTLLIYGLSVVLLISPWKGMRWLGAAGLLFGMVAMLLLGVRNPLLFALFVFGYGWNLQIRQVRLRELVLYSAGFLFLFLAVAMLRLGQGLDYSWVMKLSKKEMDLFWQGLFTPIYEYIANNYWNLDHALHKVERGIGHPHTWGFALLDGVLNLTGIGRQMQIAHGWDSIMNESIRKLYHLNTVGYQWPAYKDFGMAGVAVVAFVWGWWATWVHQSAQARKNALVTAFSGSVQFAILFGFFAWYFILPSYVYVVLVLGILAKLSPMISRRRTGP